MQYILYATCNEVAIFLMILSLGAFSIWEPNEVSVKLGYTLFTSLLLSIYKSRNIDLY